MNSSKRLHNTMVDIKTFGLKGDLLFVILNPLGDIIPTALSPQEGLFRDDTRFLSRLELRVNGQVPHLLSSTVKEDNLLFTADLTNPRMETDDTPVHRDVIHIFRSIFVWDNTLHERIRMINFDLRPVEFTLELLFDADFHDVFEIRGVRRKDRGEMLPPETGGNRVVYTYNGKDGITRFTYLNFNPAPDILEPRRALFHITLKPQASKELVLGVTADYRKRKARLQVSQAYTKAARRVTELHKRSVEIHTSNEHFNELLRRSKADICTMVTETPHGPYYYAGIPWYSTAFGRDGLITALECLWINPENARGVLRFLAAHQAHEVDPGRDAEPGKIPHEMRSGEMARTGEVPFERYYGSVDATPLFIILAGEYLKRTGDLETIKTLWPNLKSAFRWMKTYGDADGDGFIEYHRHSEKGLVNQGWKDSFDSVFHSDGSLATGPVALAEVQGYGYLACQFIASIAKALGEREMLSEALLQAKRIKKAFHRAFWSPRTGMYALALDGNKAPCEVRSSNAGQVLLSGLVSKRYAKAVTRALMSEAFFSGWGIRTVSKGEVRYNPMSYHNGSVWPHDNALIAWGFARYGFKDEILRILTGLFDASLFIELRRLPELFCGFDRRTGEGPTLYPVACQPQAWASGAVFLILQAAMGLEFDHVSRSIIFKSPRLPSYLNWLEIKNLSFMDATVDLFLERYKDDVVVKVVDKSGDLHIVIYK